MVSTCASHKRRVVILAFNDQGKRIGESHHNAKISDEMVDLIRELHEDYGQRPWGKGTRTLGAGYKTLARQFGLSIPTIKKILLYERRAQTPARYKRVTIYS